MFFHPIRKKESKIKLDSKKIKEYHDSVGLTPIVCNLPVNDFMLNDFGHVRNDIQMFMRTNDPNLQRSILSNLELVRSNNANRDLTVQDVFDTIIPNNVQTLAEINAMSETIAQRYDGFKSRHTKVSDLVEKSPVKDESVQSVQVAPES